MTQINIDNPEFKELMSVYSCAIQEVETKFNVLNTQFTARNDYNPIDSIKTRLKSPESIAEKLERRGLPLTVDAIDANLTDVAGVRIICPFEEDIYTAAQCLLSQDDVRLVARKDYIQRPKGNGYRSLHLIVSIPVYLPEGPVNVNVEVQMRTIAMELWAELEHRLRYKQNLDPELAADIADELRECADDCANLDRRMSNAHRKIDACNTFLNAKTSAFPKITL